MISLSPTCLLNTYSFFPPLIIKPAKPTLLLPPDPFPSGYVSQKLPRVVYHRKFSLHRHSLRVETRAPRPCNLLFPYGQQNALHARTELSVGIFGTIRTSHIIPLLAIPTTNSRNNAPPQNFLQHSPLVSPIHLAQQF